MGEPNNALNVYMRNPDRIRSVLEYYLGEKLPEGWTFTPDDGFYSIRNRKGKLSFRQRDQVRKVQTCNCSFYLGLENQETVNLTFPWRLMELDSLTYGRGIEEVQEKNRTTKVVYKKGDDFKYSYRKEDRLLPILNLMLYWGKRKWESPLSLRDMVEMDESLPKKLQRMFNDYRVHLIHMRLIPEEALQEMDSDLRYVLGLMRRESSMKKFDEYIWENRDYFEEIPKSAVDVIDVCMNIKDIKSHMKYILNPETGEEEADMCKALREIKKDAERRGREGGRKEGIQEGRVQGELHLGTLMQKLLSDGRVEDARLAAVDETARNRLYGECGIVNPYCAEGACT